MLDAFDVAWGRRYPGTVKMWRDTWERFIVPRVPARDQHGDLHHAIESLSYQLRKTTKTGGHFPTDRPC